MEVDDAVRHKPHGFTLVELVTTAAIFGILGAMLFSMVRSGMDMWTRGEAQREEVERAATVLDTITRELHAAFTENDPLALRSDVRFLCDFVDLDCNGDGSEETRVQRLMFVRINSEERENLALRTAGDLPLGRRYFTLTRDDRVGAENAGAGGAPAEEDPSAIYRPTGGLAEALFMAFPPVVGGKAQTGEALSFYRGYRSPIGGEDSFFAPGALLTPASVAFNLAPVMGGLLRLEFRFWDQDTLTFDTKEAPARSKGGAGYTWDSTRGIIPPPDVSALNTFRLAKGPESLADPSDDVFPERVQITIVVNAGGRREGLARLTANVKDTDMRIPVNALKPFTEWRFGDRLVRLDGEWIRFKDIEGRDLVVAERGALNTIPSAHSGGSTVYAGRTFTAQVAIPTKREAWNGND
jgi:prepilin-type N-terminal cleavage/methylation domain-containing protein